MLYDPYGARNIGPRFNTIDWIPARTASPQASGSGITGDRTQFPVSMTAREAVGFYWKPRNIGISKVRIVCDYFEKEMNVPIFPTGPRPNGVYQPDGKEANSADQLVWGIGASVTGSQRVSVKFHPDYNLFAEFIFIPSAVATSSAGVDLINYQIQATVSALPFSTDKAGIARTFYVGDDYLEAGSVKLLWVIDEATGLAKTITLWRPRPILPSSVYFTNFQALLELDYIPWDFEA